jgi:hypothetical protein
VHITTLAYFEGRVSLGFVGLGDYSGEGFDTSRFTSERVHEPR